MTPSLRGRAMRRIGMMSLVVAIVACGGPRGGPAATSGPTATPAPSAVPTRVPSPAGALGIADDAEILFEWYAARSVKDLLIVRADGADRHVIAGDVAPGLRHNAASWSHDGRRIVFVVGELYASSVWIADGSGADARPVLEPGDGCRLGMSSPAWSPDDAAVLFVCNDGASDVDPKFTSTIEVLTLAGGPIRTVIGVAAPSQIVQAAWSRDGETIVYQQGEYDAVS